MESGAEDVTVLERRRTLWPGESEKPAVRLLQTKLLEPAEFYESFIFKQDSI